MQQAVKQRVGHGTVKIDVTSDPSLLRVLVINSPLRGLPADRRKAKAREAILAGDKKFEFRRLLFKRD